MYIRRCRILCSIYIYISNQSINPITFSSTFTSSSSSFYQLHHNPINRPAISDKYTQPKTNLNLAKINHIPPSLPSSLPPIQLTKNPSPLPTKRKKKCASSTKSAAAAATTATSKPDAPTTPEEVSHHVVEHMEFGIRVERLWQGLRIVVRADHRY